MIEFLIIENEIKEQLNLKKDSILIFVKKELNIIGFGKINFDNKDLSLYINQNYRDNGYGKELLFQLLKEAKIQNYENVYMKCLNNDYIMQKLIMETKGVHISTNYSEEQYIIPLDKIGL